MNKIIGIDPGKTTGFAVYDTESKKLESLLSTSFWGAIEKLDRLRDKIFIVILEMPKTKHVWHKSAKNKLTMQRNAVDVGSVIREAELLREYLMKEGISYITQHPLGKIDHQKFSLITGWDRKTNQHTRDAGMLVYGFNKNLFKAVDLDELEVVKDQSEWLFSQSKGG